MAPIKPRKVKSLVSFQHETNVKSGWEDVEDDKKDKESTNSAPIALLSNDIALRPFRRADAKEVHKILQDPAISHHFPDTTYMQPYSLWRAHKWISKALDTKESWVRRNPAPSTYSSTTYERAVRKSREEVEQEKRWDEGNTNRASKPEKTPNEDEPLLPTYVAITKNDIVIGAIYLGLENETARPDPAFIANAEICYWLSKVYRGQGIMTSALKAFIDWSWENFAHLERIDAAVYSTWNDASGNVLRKLGFQYEGVWKGSVRKDGKFGDISLFAIARPGGEIQRTCGKIGLPERFA